MTEYVIIVGGGQGTRMGSEIPKQFLDLAGKPVLIRTIEPFINYNNNIKIILVLGRDQLDRGRAIIGDFLPHQDVLLTAGGDTRFQSVKNGLEEVGNSGYVAIHDAVRPLVSEGLISRSYETARTHAAAIVVTPLKESLRVVKGNESYSADRNLYRSVQTPQVFEVNLVKKAYQQEELITFTDDASVVEANGGNVEMVEGSYSNIKITTPEDMLLAEVLLTSANTRPH